MRLFYKGTGRTGGTVHPMSKQDRFFAENRHKAEEARQLRLAGRKERAKA